MSDYIPLLTLTGLATFAMAWMPAFTKRTGISYAVLYIAAGALLYTIAPVFLPTPLPQVHEMLTLRLSELVVIISLMGTGIRIDRAFSFRHWKSPLRLVSVAMLLCIGVATWLGYSFLGFALPSALLLAAVLAPTDPVLASDVQVGEPNERQKFETKFALTAEAGLNDGMAFPFVWLAMALAGLGGGELLPAIGKWAAYDVLYRIGVGLIIGYAAGRLVGALVLRISEKYNLLKNDGFLAISLTLLVYGLTELAHGYGFIAVFIAALNFRHFEKEHKFHDELHDFTDQSERLLIAVMLLLLGGSLVSGLLDALTWRTAVFALVFLFVVRPLAGYISLLGVKMDARERLSISFYGIRGLGTIFYLAFAFHETHFEHSDELWAAAGFTILVSAVVHGFTATRVMRALKKKLPVEDIPE